MLSRGIRVGTVGKVGDGRGGRNAMVCGAVATDRAAQRGPRVENVPGDFFVDHTCINCGTCRWMAPESFTLEGNKSAVTNQPADGKSRKEAMEALVACPTYSIHVQSPEKGEIARVRGSFPKPVEDAPGVYHCGFHDEKSYGGTGYLVVRPEGNIMVDSPSFKPGLVKKIEELGGIRWIFLTHKDDVGDHMKWAERFNADRIIHKLEVNDHQGTTSCEVQVTGEGPWFLSDGSEDVIFLGTPGHSDGSICMYHKPTRVFFTGDHIAYSHGRERLTLFKTYGWNMEKQIESVRSMFQYNFMHILPGHGGPFRFKDAEQRDAMIEDAIQHAYDD